MDKLQMFNHSYFGEVRTIYNEIEDEIWFVGKDIASKLGYQSYQNMFRLIDDYDKKEINPQSQLYQRLGENGVTLEPNPNVFRMMLINESGFYSAVFGSQLPQAKEFKNWVTSEVLPSIRKHGAYMTPDKLKEVLLNPDTLIQLAQNLKEEQERNKKLQAINQEMKPKALFADAVKASKTSILIGQLAKLIKQNGYDIGQNRLFDWLRDNGYLIKRKGEDYNTPTQYSMDLGLMEIKKTTINNPDGSVRTTKTPKITGKGQIYFINKFLSN